MRILLATPLYPPDVGGPATYSKLLYEGLPSRGFNITVLSFGSVRHLPKLVRHIVYAVCLFRAARDADLVFAQDPFSTGAPAYLASLLRRKPLVLKIVGDYAWEQGVRRFGVTHTPDTFSRRPGSDYHPMVRVFKWVEYVVASRSQAIIVPSEYLRTIVSNWGIPKDRISVIYNGFRDFDVGGRKNVLRGMVKARGEVVMSAGRLVPWKGFDLLIKAVPNLLKRFPNLKLLIAGDGPEMGRLEHLAGRLGVGAHVVFLGRQSQDVLCSYIKLADVFALATKYEGFSHQLLEVMAVGTPVVTTAVGGNPELIEHGKHGLLVKRDNVADLGQTIAKLLSDRQLRERLARGAKRRVQDFSEEQMLEKTAALLKRTTQ